MAPVRIAVVYIGAGSGHRTCALAISRSLTRRGVCVTMVSAESMVYQSIPSVYEEISAFNRAMSSDSISNFPAIAEAAVGNAEYLDLKWTHGAYDAVISTSPIYNRPIGRAAISAGCKRYVVVPLDYTEVCPWYWFGFGEAACMTDLLLSESMEYGSVAWSIDGAPVDESYSEVIRQPWSSPTWSLRPTALITGGLTGYSAIESVANAISGCDINAIFACGSDINAASRIEKMNLQYRHAVLTAADGDIGSDIMSSCDFVIAKGSTMITAESAAAGRYVLMAKSNGLRAIHSIGEDYVRASGNGMIFDKDDLRNYVRYVVDNKITATTRRNGMRSLCEMVIPK